jgi:hypothetical protein
MKNPNFDKEDYKSLKQIAKADGVRTISHQCHSLLYSGLTVAYKRASEQPGCKMVWVAVSYCAIEDEFKKKVGKYQALLKYNIGETIQLPLGGVKDEELEEFLLDIFVV